MTTNQTSTQTVEQIPTSLIMI